MGDPQINRQHEFLRPRRIGICGGGDLPKCVAEFCSVLGFELAGEDGLVLVTGGSRHYPDRPSLPATDWAVIKGALARLEKDGIPPSERIETLLPDPGSTSTVHFRAGKTYDLRNLSWQARRFTLVSTSDALLAVHGREGTQLQIDLALAINHPCLPLPFTGAISTERWKANKELIRKHLSLDEETIGFWEDNHLAEESPSITCEDRYLALARSVIRPLPARHGNGDE
jgi:hypothetical protein